MSRQLRARHHKGNGPFALSARHRFLMGSKEKLCVRVNESLDEPSTSDTIHTDTLSCKPFHFLLPLPSEGDLSHFRRRVGAETMEATITVLVGLFRTFGLIKGELLATDGQLEPSNSRYKGSSYAYHSP